MEATGAAVGGPTTWMAMVGDTFKYYKNKNFIDPQTEMHLNIKFGASIFGKSKTNKKYNCACNMTFTSIIYGCC